MSEKSIYLLRDISNNPDALFKADLKEAEQELTGYEDELAAIDIMLANKK